VLRKLAVLLLVAVVGVTAFFVFHHPPMRLMPPSLMFQEGGDRVFDLAPALAEGSELEIFYATSRLPVGPPDNRVYTVAPDWRLHVGKSTLLIGEEGSTLDQLREGSARQADAAWFEASRISGTKRVCRWRAAKRWR
jgi:hypothetical protein